MKLSGAQLKKICPTLPMDKACHIAHLMNQVLPLYDMDDPNIFHEFIANVAIESKEFQTLVENMNYSTEVLRDTFGKHRISDADVMKYGAIKGKQKANQQMIANIVYGGTFGKNELGNIHQNDGWIFRGAGWLQITGRKNQTLFTVYYNNRFGTNHTIEQMVDLIRTDYYYAAHSACWVFAVAKKLIPYAITDNLKAIVKKIVGGISTLDNRHKYYLRAIKAIPHG